MNLIKTSAPGNLFFFGEHAVVYGMPAICAAVGRRTNVEIKKRDDKQILVESESFGKGKADFSEKGIVNRETKKQELSATFDFIEMILPKLNISEGFEMKISSNVPVNSGMSSSTALLSAALKGLSLFSGKNISQKDYFDFLYPLQVKIHGGRASGAEIISSALGGFNKVQKIENNGHTKLEWKHLGEHKFSVVVGNTKVSAPTSLTVGYHIPSLIARNKKFVFDIFDEISAISNKAEKTIEKDDAKGLGKLMNKNQELLASLGLSHPKLDDCINEARNAGALGAKLSGSGWGGIMFALVNERDTDKVMRAIQSTGADAFKTDVGGVGVI